MVVLATERRQESVREKAGFGFDANSWKIAKVKKICRKNLLKICGKFVANLYDGLKRIGVYDSELRHLDEAAPN
jgi:hypothetical protein